MQDERYARYLEDPEALLSPAAAEDGERVLMEVLDDEQREEIVRSTAVAIDADEDRVRKLLPLTAALAMAALGQQLREPSPRIPWFGTHPGDRFDAPLLDALAALFGHDEERSDKRHWTACELAPSIAPGDEIVGRTRCAGQVVTSRAAGWSGAWRH
jgi:hypothetical protein